MGPINPINRKGFTLFEILIAMFIFAVVMSTIFTSYTGTFRIIDDTESRAEIYAMARIALARMQEDLESVHFQTAVTSESEKSQFLGENKEIEGRDADDLRFLSRAHLIFSEEDESPGIAEISYYIGEDEESDGLVLYRSDTPALGESPEHGTGGLVLCNGLFSVNVNYYDDDGEIHESWDSSKEEFNNGLPAMISILLQFADEKSPEKPHKFMMCVALPMAGGKHE